MEPLIFSVSQITRRIKHMLETGLSTLSVQGELSNVKLHSSGHLYFTLKDEGSQISGVMWRSKVQTLTMVPEDGMKVVARGRIGVYEARGVYQLDTVALAPLGVGELQIAFERLKTKLAKEGLFDQDSKLALPAFPERIGIITSSTGAALQDMLNILRRRFGGLEVVIRPARVQGAGAAQDIAGAITECSMYGELDVLIIARGGGSMEDLWAFNEEVVARAIYACKIPTISAIGHETDFTIADFVADLRAPTPSAAAELVVRDRETLLEVLRKNWYTMDNSMRDMIRSHSRHIQHLLKSHSLNRPVDLLHECNQRTDELTRTLASLVGHKVAMVGGRVTELQKRISALSPELVLKRGYALVYKNNDIVTSTAMVKQGESIRVQLSDGSIRSKVL